jgi:hypothetical protein
MKKDAADRPLRLFTTADVQPKSPERQHQDFTPRDAIDWEGISQKSSGVFELKMAILEPGCILFAVFARFRGQMPGHQQIDRRSLAFGHAIAERLKSHPEFITRARVTLARWLTTVSPRVSPALLEWSQILEGPLDGVLEILTSTGERATRLRQSNPFAGVLPASERNAILRRFQDETY